MRRRKALLGLLAAVMAAGGTVEPGATAAPTTARTAVPTGDVRLLSGDVVTLGGPQGAQVRAAEGREHVSFRISKDEHGDTHVVPEDAIVPLAQGKLDPALFDVSELARNGYGDTLPLIVDHAGPTPRSAAARVTRELPVLSAVAVEADRSGAYWPTVRTASRVWLDAPVRMTLDQSVPQIGAPAAWAAGHTGAGTTVAVLDSGIDATHPDLADAVVAVENFSDSETTDDRDGHGTHIASIITGDGDKYRGVAPDARLLVGKVIGDDGLTSTSWVIAGMEWAAAKGADVVNLSLGTPRPSDGTDPMSQAVDRLTADTGTLFVVSAGNVGGTPSAISSPAAADAALAVGAVDRADKLAYFSSLGPRPGDDALKPDITAPGVDIVAAKAKNGVQGTPAADGYVSLSGTSMATPHVAGAAAILAGQHPDWTGGQLKSALMGTAKPNGDLTAFQQGAGRVDVAAATETKVVASVGSLSLGKVAWPHDDDEPITRELTYTNTGSAPVTLDLAADVTGPNEVRAPQGMFTFSPAQLTIPAGGRATTTVTTDTRVDAADGVYTGAFTATGGGQAVRTPVTIHREVESHVVTLKVLDHGGVPTDLYSPRFTNVAPEPHYPTTYRPYDPSGTVTVRLPKGEYFFDATVLQQIGDEDYRNAEFAEPAFTVTGDTELVIDAREAKPVSMTTDRPNAKPGKGWVVFVRDTAFGEVGVQASGQRTAYETMTVKPSTTSSDAFRFAAEAHLAEWNGKSFDGSPYLYHLRHSSAGVVPQTLEWVDHDRDLAEVRSEHAQTTPGTVGKRDYFLKFPLPGGLTEYYTPDKEWRYELEFREFFEDDPFSGVTSSRQIAPLFFPRGRVTHLRWGVGVYAPAMPNVYYMAAADNAGRWPDDVIRFSVPVSDQDPGRISYIRGDGGTQLLRDGVVVGEYGVPGEGVYRVGPERANYTLRMSGDRSSFARLSTRISAEWTFTSERVTEMVALPLLVLRFAPNLDDHNAAPAGRRFTIPLYVQRNGSEAPSAVKRPRVEVSYDDGRSWRPAPVSRDRGRWEATVNHPAGAEFVSLRSTVSAPDGDTHRQTVIRAYALTPVR